MPRPHGRPLTASSVRADAARAGSARAISAGVTSVAPDDRPRALVVGAGLGGLAAGMRLGAKGYRVTVLDRLDGPGGRGSAISRDGHRFDLGPTIVTAPKVFEELWETAGRRFEDDVTLRALDPYYEIRFPDGARFRVSGDDAAMRDEITRLSPRDVAGYERLIEDGRARYDFGFEGLGRRSSHRFATLAAALPGFARLRADRSVHGHVARRIRDPRLRMALSFHPLFIGGDPFKVTSIYVLVSYLEKAFGVHYAMGGVGAIAAAMARAIEDQGGTVRYGAEVDEILVANDRAAGARLTTGEAIAADLVVSNADPGHTYERLLRGRTKRRWTSKRLHGARWSMSLFVWHFGTKDSRAAWPDVGHHTILNGPRYRELVRDIFLRGRLAEDMSLYIHRPSVTDPSAAPPGGDTFYALSPVPHLGFDNGVDWRVEGERYRARVQRVLEETLLPGLGARLTASHVMTPLDFESRYLSPFGSGFSLEPRILQSAYFRPHNVSEELDGLFLVGAGTHPGAGLPGVLSSAEAACALIPDARPKTAPAPTQAPTRPTEPVSAETAVAAPAIAASAAAAEADLAVCRAAIRTGSYSFHAASRLLPRRTRDPALALYAFCRQADDAVDDAVGDAVDNVDVGANGASPMKARAVATLRRRLEKVYAGRPDDAPADRAFARVVEAHEIPQAAPAALLEGFDWDAEGRRYADLSELRAYGARVASSVGVMMCLIMGARGRDALARACDLGLAMQLTNIARDVGEDARAGRLYLPLDALADAGVDPDAFLARPEATPGIRAATKRLLAEAERLYARSEAGVGALPLDCRAGIMAARRVYAAIGARVAAAGFDGVSRRARTSNAAKLGLIARAGLDAALMSVSPRSAVLYARPRPETAFLVEAAAADPAPADAWSDGPLGAVISALAELEARDRQTRRGFDRGTRSAT